MDSKFYDNLKESTEALTKLFADSGMSDQDKQLIVTAYTENIKNNVGRLENLESSLPMIYSTYVQYIDGRLKKFFVLKAPSYDQCQAMLKLCELQKENFALMKKNGWGLPALTYDDMVLCNQILNSKMESISTYERITSKYRQIVEKTEAVNKEPSLEACAKILDMISDLEKDIDQSSLLPADKKSNQEKIAKMRKQVAAINEVAGKKENIYAEIKEADARIVSYESRTIVTKDEAQNVLSICKQQIERFNMCQKSRWPIPKVAYDEFSNIMEKNRLYIDMLALDEVLTKTRADLSSDAQYEAFYEICQKQQNNIDTCVKKGWRIPKLSIQSPKVMISAVKMEKEKAIRDRETGKNIVTFGVVCGCILMVVLLIYFGYTSGKARIPFDSLEVRRENYKAVREKLEDAGFDNIELVEDKSGWEKDGEVISVMIDDTESYRKGQHKKPDVKIVISYSSKERVSVEELLDDLDNADCEMVRRKLSNAGFTNITINKDAEITGEKDKDGTVSGIMLNGKKYDHGECYIPKDAPIVISCYVYKISFGMEYEKLLNDSYGNNLKIELEERGFTNVNLIYSKNGWRESESVIEIKVDGNTGFDYNESYLPNVRIDLICSSKDRIEITDKVSNLDTKTYDEVYDMLKRIGVTDVKLNPTTTDKKDINKRIIKISIGYQDSNNWYTNGKCYIDTDETIIIDYYALRTDVGEKEDTLKKKSYGEIVEYFEEKGFTNVTVKRTNKVPWPKNEGSIKSIKIDGKSGFKAKDTFDFDVPIIIIVYTKDTGYEDITIIADEKE